MTYVSAAGASSVALDFVMGIGAIASVGFNTIVSLTPVDVKVKFRIYIPRVDSPTLPPPHFADIAINTELYVASDTPNQWSFGSAYSASALTNTIAMPLDLILNSSDGTDTLTVNYATGRLIC